MKRNILFIFFTLSHLLIKAQVSNEILGTTVREVVDNGIGPEETNLNTGESITFGDYNVLIGDGAGARLTTGHNNTFLGTSAGLLQTTAYDNTFIGRSAGFFNITGTDNTFIGAEAGRSNTATDNTFIGTEAGELNTTGYDNTFIGEEAGTKNTTGYENVFIGEDAGFENTTGHRQVFIGNEAGLFADVGYRNTGIGNDALQDVDEGHHNTAVGDSTGIDVGKGIYNTFLGAAAGVATEDADYNTFIGSMAGWDNNRTNRTNNANRNTYLGHMTGAVNRDGQDNVGVGAFAGYGPSGWSTDGTGHFFSGNTNRNRTTFIGSKAEAENNDVIVMGYFAQSNARYGVMIGNESYLRDAEGAIAMGYQAQGSNNADYSVFLGYQANVDEDNAVGIGRSVDIDKDQAVAIGANAVIQNSGAIAIGYGAQSNDVIDSSPTGPTPTATEATNNIAIGYQAMVSGNNAIAIGNAATATNANTMVLGGATNPVSVGIGTNTPNAYASLELADVNKGILFNRMTTSQRNTLGGNLGTSEASMTVYDTDLNAIFCWTGAAWTDITNAFDNLGNHTARQDLDLDGNKINNVSSISYGTSNLSIITFNGNSSTNSITSINTGLTSSFVYGPVFGNNRTKFSAGNANNEGFVWGPFSSTPIAALSNEGNFQIAGYLNIAGAYQFPTTDGTANQVLVTDGSGALSWTTQTDNQTVDQFEITSNTLNLSISGDGEDAKTVDLSPYLDNTDAQELSLTTNILGITGNATTVDLAPYLDNTDAQELALSDANVLSISGNVTTIDLAPFLDNTDAQELSLTTNTLGITGSTTTIDLAPYLDNTDAQALEYDNTNQMLAITGSSGSDVDLSGLLDNTDTQSISFSNDVLSISGNASTVDLSGYTNTDSQTLSIDGSNNLTISGSNSSVALGPYLDNTDEQELTLSGANVLSISGGNNTINLAPFLDNTDTQVISIDSNILMISGSNTEVNLEDYLDNTDAQALSFNNDILSISGNASTVDLSTYLDNTDEQELALSGANVLSISGGTNTVDLAPFLDNTDVQALSFSNDILSISGNASTVDLSAYANTDEQAISITNDVLNITGNTSTVDLSVYKDNTDEQTLSFNTSNNQLSISTGNSVDLSSLVTTISDDQNLTSATLTNGTLDIGIEGGSGISVDLSPILSNLESRATNAESRLATLETQMTTILNKLNDLDDCTGCGSGTLSFAPTSLSNSQKSQGPILYQNTPNPFLNETFIKYFLPIGTTNAKIVFTTVAGNTIKTVRLTETGEQEFKVNKQSLASGVYFYSLHIGSKLIDTKRMIKK